MPYPIHKNFYESGKALAELLFSLLEQVFYFGS